LTVQAQQQVPFVGPPGDTSSRSPVEADIPKTLDSPTTESHVPDVGEQILDTVRAAVRHGDREVQIRLDPPELGTVVVRFREQGANLEGTLEVDRGETRRDLERALPEVIRNLQDAGIHVRRFDVTSGDMPDQGPGKGQAQQGAWSGPHDSGHAREQFATPQTRGSAGERELLKDPTTGDSGERPVQTPPGRIDMLL
jgi:flagellar hook-length control protein FliK